MALNTSSSSAKVGGKNKKVAFSLWLLAFVILLIGFVWALVNYYQTKSQLEKLSTPAGQQELAKQETEAIVAKVKKLIVLPTNEQPTIATITDAASIAKEQPFYQNAHNGDKVLIYVQAKKAIIYDAVNDILVNVGPVFIDNSNAQQTASVEANTLSVEVRNGSLVKGAATTLSDELKKDVNINVVGVENAVNDKYQGNLIVDLSKGLKSDLVATLKAKFPEVGIVEALPEGEAITTAEVVVIVGN